MYETPDAPTSLGSLVAGLLAGALIGAAVSLLFAPKPGREMRAELSTRLDELKERVDQTARELASAARTRLEETTADLSQAVDVARVSAAQHAAELQQQAGLE